MNIVTQERLDEILEEITEIQEEMCPLVDRIAYLVNELGDENARVYLLAPLQIHADCDNIWVSRDLSLTTWKKRLKEELTEEEEQEDSPKTRETHFARDAK